ncbi:ribosomal RNA small subunit methyltransferase nep-1 [Dorcoceras hygrometricum]|nr:ribosomal RNA small subunit methyltransferase nep-1 [Dorcoceras hygrometricum]
MDLGWQRTHSYHQKGISFRDSENCDPTIPSKSSKSVEIGSILPGIPLRASSQEPRSGVVFVFEKASLVLAKINKSYQIINADMHVGFMKKHNLDRSDYRPDIILEDGGYPEKFFGNIW